VACSERWQEALSVPSGQTCWSTSIRSTRKRNGPRNTSSSRKAIIRVMDRQDTARQDMARKDMDPLVMKDITTDITTIITMAGVAGSMSSISALGAYVLETRSRLWNAGYHWGRCGILLGHTGF
jgi:hypothetical protein